MVLPGIPWVAVCEFVVEGLSLRNPLQRGDRRVSAVVEAGQVERDAHSHLAPDEGVQRGARRATRPVDARFELGQAGF